MKTLLKWFSFSLLIISPNIIFAQEIKKSIKFAVLDESRNFIENLQAPDIQVLQNKNQLKINSVNQIASKSLDVAVMIDSSISQENILPIAKSVANGFIEQSLDKSKDRIAVIKFSNKFSIEQPLTNNFVAATLKLSQIEIDMLEGQPIVGDITLAQILKPLPNTQDMKGSTSLWDTIKVIGEQVFENSVSKKLIFLITDGIDTSSEKGSLKNTLEVIRKSQIPVYVIGMGDKNYKRVDGKSLNKLAEETGGIAFVPNKNSDLRLIFREIEQSARFHYEVEFSINAPLKESDLADYKVTLANRTTQNTKVKISQSRPY